MAHVPLFARDNRKSRDKGGARRQRRAGKGGWRHRKCLLVHNERVPFLMLQPAPIKLSQITSTSNSKVVLFKGVTHLSDKRRSGRNNAAENGECLKRGKVSN